MTLTSRFQRPATHVTVVVLANDPLTYGGLTACLRAYPGLETRAPDDAVHADVVLIVTGAMTEETLSRMRHAAATTTNREMRIVLAADLVRESHLPPAVGYGLVSIVPRGDAEYDRIARAVLGSRRWSPDVVLGWLTGHVRALYRSPLSRCAA
jgi:hypothetical protein